MNSTEIPDKSNVSVVKLIILTVAVVIFTFAGGTIFHFLEKPHEQKSVEENQKLIRERRRNYSNKIEEIGQNCQVEEISCRDQMELLLLEYDKETGVSEKEKYPAYNWQSYINAVWFSTTIYTTIGYGSLSPKTNAGKIAVIFYGLVGIPLVLLFLNELGKAMRAGLDIVYGEIYSKLYKTNDQPLKFPIFLTVSLIVSHLLFCGWLMTLIESDWSYCDGIYFFFITLTTIGFGDIMPSEPSKILWAFSMLIFGLAMFAWLLSIINERMQRRFDNITRVEELDTNNL